MRLLFLASSSSSKTLAGELRPSLERKGNALVTSHERVSGSLTEAMSLARGPLDFCSRRSSDCRMLSAEGLKLPSYPRASIASFVAYGEFTRASNGK